MDLGNLPWFLRAVPIGVSGFCPAIGSESDRRAGSQRAGLVRRTLEDPEHWRTPNSP